jgi:hypothetical protein
MINAGNKRARPQLSEDTVLSARPNALALMLDLAKRLAEEFDTVPLAQVSRAVKAGADAARLFGEDITAALPTIELLAREDLTVLAEATSSAVTA